MDVTRRHHFRLFIWVLGLFLFAAMVGGLFDAPTAKAQLTEGRQVPAESPMEGAVPGGTLGTDSSSEIWRALRRGEAGRVAIPDPQAGVLIQSEGDNWRAIRNGPLKVYGAWVVLGMIGLLALFFLLRGRIRIDAGASGRTIERFNALDRFAHWTTAISFIVLAITGLNILWGRYLLLPLIGPEAFGAVTLAGKYAHNYLAFPFMLGLVMMFVLWVRHNFPNRYDVIWLLKGGGLFVKGSHPPARKFNAGQKLVFWAVILGGASLSLSGIGLMFPFQTAMWAGTFDVLNSLGLQLPTDISPMMEQQLNSLWHAVVALILIAVILAHIYIGSIGMEGAFAAMGSGKVDENWAREHHGVWVAEIKGEPLPGKGGHSGGGASGTGGKKEAPQPAE